MRDEAYQMEMAILINAAGDLKDLRFQNRIGIVPYPVVCQGKLCDDGSEIVIELSQYPPVLKRGFDFLWSG